MSCVGAWRVCSEPWPCSTPICSPPATAATCSPSRATSAVHAWISSTPWRWWSCLQTRIVAPRKPSLRWPRPWPRRLMPLLIASAPEAASSTWVPAPPDGWGCWMPRNARPPSAVIPSRCKGYSPVVPPRCCAAPKGLRTLRLPDARIWRSGASAPRTAWWASPPAAPPPTCAVGWRSPKASERLPSPWPVFRRSRPLCPAISTSACSQALSC